jgi:hypothetical protein
MAVSRREQALAAFMARLDTLSTTFRFIGRWPNHRLAATDLPALAMFDGPESAEPGEVNTLRCDTTVTVRIVAAADSTGALIPVLNGHLATVRQALGTDPTLGGRVWHVGYAGCDQPELETEEGSGAAGLLEATFVITRSEHELDPYSA